MLTLKPHRELTFDPDTKTHTLDIRIENDENQDINIDNSKRMEAIMYEGVPPEETSAFYGTWYFAIEDMMLAELY